MLYKQGRLYSIC